LKWCSVTYLLAWTFALLELIMARAQLGGGTAEWVDNRVAEDEEIASNVDGLGTGYSDMRGGCTKRFPLDFEEWTASIGPSGIPFAEAYVASVVDTQPTRETWDLHPYSVANVTKMYWNLGYFVLPSNKTVWEWQVRSLVNELAQAWKRRSQITNPFDSNSMTGANELAQAWNWRSQITNPFDSNSMTLGITARRSPSDFTIYPAVSHGPL